MKNLYKFPSLCLWLSGLIISLGIFYLSSINISLYPDTSRPVVYISASHKGIDPLAFKKEYGDQIESSLKAVEDAEEVEGNYDSEHTYWQVTFPWNYKSSEALSKAKSATSAIASTFPREWGGLYYRFGSNSNAQLILSVLFSNHSIFYF